MPPHRAQAPALHPRKVVSHFPLCCKGFHRRKPQHSHRALDEERGGVYIRSRVETITPQPPPPPLSAPGVLRNFLWHTLETMLGVRRNFAWALRSLLPALLAQFWGSRRTLRRKLALGAHCRREANSWLPKKISTSRVAPALAPKLLAAKRSQPPPATIFAGSSPF